MLRGAAVFTPKGLVSADIGVSGGRIAKIGDIRPGSGAVEDNLAGLVITSYSIHYTKLYDMPRTGGGCGPRPSAPAGIPSSTCAARRSPGRCARATATASGP